LQFHCGHAREEETCAPGEIAGIAPAELMKRVTRDAAYRGWMKAFLG